MAQTTDIIPAPPLTTTVTRAQNGDASGHGEPAALCS